MIVVLTFLQNVFTEKNFYGCFTSSKMDRWVYWSVFPERSELSIV